MSDVGYEVNFDGLVGPTHNYGGLSPGNLPSMENKGSVSNPREAALQGLEKMKFMTSLGVKQAVLPPQERPHIPTLKALGFSGGTEQILSQASAMPWILNNCSSASSMWAANSATVCPSIDSVDPHVHFTPANLAYEFHRRLETETTARILKAIFANSTYFTHHSPLPSHGSFADEGAANHSRLCREYNGPGIQLFAWGKSLVETFLPKPQKYPARYTLEAAQAIVRSHQLFSKQVVFAQINPQAIDMGVFHADLCLVANKNFIFFHEHAFLNSEALIKELGDKLRQTCDIDLHAVMVPNAVIPLQDGVKTFLFNSQIITLPDGSMNMICPKECEQIPAINSLLDEMRENADNPIRHIYFVNLLQSMRNGGGPACLRLRVVLNDVELNAVNPAVFMSDTLYTALVSWVNRYYPEKLTAKELADPKLFQNNQEALDSITKILGLGSIYSFQMT